jgi:hypothetical protein
MSWIWNPAHIIGVNAADPKPNPFAMDRTPEQIFLLWKSKLKRKRKWPGAGASTVKNHHFVMGHIPVLNPHESHVYISLK